VNTGNTVDAKERATLRTILPLVALGGGLVAGPATALELGDINVQSSLGQPLRASIAYALAPNEMLSNTCVSVSAGRSTGGLPGIGGNTVTITERAIVITGDTVIREPMLGTRVTINCPYTPNLSREYMLFVDPARVVATQAAEAATLMRPVAAPSEVSASTKEAPSVRPATVNDAPIDEATRYQVQPGETLSEIVQRIENRSMALWPAVNAIFAANPDAFIDNDPNKLKAGSWLTIPSLDGTAPVVAAPEAGESPASAEQALATPAVSDRATTMEPIETYDPAAFDAPAEVPADTVAVTDSTEDLKPGNVAVDDSPVAPADTVDIPDTRLQGPQTTAASPNVPTAIISTGSRSESTSLLMWLVGGGLAIIAALLLFGRRVRGRFGSTPVGPAIPDRREQQPDATVADTFADYDIDDDSPTDENRILDADLVIGTGLNDGVDVDIAQDFGFAATSELDLELPFEPEAPAGDGDTDIIPPVTRNMESILESEILPEDEDYDMSIIMDATKMPQHEDVTERDLQAVEVDEFDEDSDGFTITREVAYDILEQDYEEELTATQALNQEIERAAAELARDLDSTVDDEQTAAMPAAPAGDATAEFPARENEPTVEFEASYDPNDTNAVTVNMSHEDQTTEMPVANDDETVEMDVESGKIDTSRRS
jgi:hypothetical protein